MKRAATPVLLLITVIGLFACKPKAPSSAPQASPGSISNSGFARRALADTVKAMALTADEPPGIVTFTGDHRSIARVTYVGKIRPIPEPHKAAILLAEKNTGTVPLADDVANEILFLENNVEYWMPVGTKTEPEFKNLTPGKVIDLYASFVAAVKVSTGPADYLFVAQEYGDIPTP